MNGRMLLGCLCVVGLVGCGEAETGGAGGDEATGEAPAFARVLHAAPGEEPVDVCLVLEDGTVTPPLLGERVAHGEVSSYIEVEPSFFAVTSLPPGASACPSEGLQSVASYVVTSGAHFTFVFEKDAFLDGEQPRSGIVAYGEDRHAPPEGQVRLLWTAVRLPTSVDVVLAVDGELEVLHEDASDGTMGPVERPAFEAGEIVLRAAGTEEELVRVPVSGAAGTVLDLYAIDGLDGEVDVLALPFTPGAP